MRKARLKALHRACRALIGRDVMQGRQCLVETVTLGEGDGRWTIGARGLDAGTVVYSFGIGRNVSFELALIERCGAVVHAFDPTPLALAWVKEQHLPPSFTVHEIGITDYDGTARFAPPRRANWDSFSLTRTSGVGTAVDAPVATLATLVARVGGAPPDVVKMDIEGAEYRVLPQLIASGFRPRQLLVEFHHRWAEIGAKPTRAAIKLLNRNGYVIAAVSDDGREYSFMLDRLDRGHAWSPT